MPDARDRFYRPDIDGIRAVAILSVVLYHAGVPLIHGGFTGVDVFFVISGYLIGGHIFSEIRAEKFSFLQGRYLLHSGKHNMWGLTRGRARKMLGAT